MIAVPPALTQVTEDIVFYPVTDARYDQAYFDKYVAMGKTTFGIALNSLRVGLVSRYLSDPSAHLVDIGVGDGAFVRARGGATFGYDINPASIEMLKRADLWWDVDNWAIESACCWDSLEHMPDPQAVVRKIRQYCFVSIPIFRDLGRVPVSKHFRPGEHYWYFTRAGLISYFWELGFVCVDMNDMETALGREDIGTFVFHRR